MLCSLCTLPACGYKQSDQVAAIEQPDIITKVEEVQDAPDIEAVLFKEVPNSSEAAKSFLDMLQPFDLVIKHVTVKDYGKGNYTLNCGFTNDSYTIMVFVKPEGDVVKWYGSLKFNDKEVTTWKYNYM